MPKSPTTLLKPAAHIGGILETSVWERRRISHRTKVKVYWAVVLSTLLYGCETWTIYRRHEKQLHQFHLWCLRSILSIHWQDKIRDTEVLERTQLPIVITTLRKARHARQVTSSECQPSEYPSSCCTVNLVKGKEGRRTMQAL